MKNFLILLFSIVLAGTFTEAIAYPPIRVAQRTTTDFESSEGIEPTLNYLADGKYEIRLFNSNYNERNDYTTYSFTWYLSYKGKRVSDYFHAKMKCRRTELYNVPAWPGEVPAGYEGYVTVQFGREAPERDRRD